MPRASTDLRFAIDIGSTVVKLAKIDFDGHILSQQFFPRDFKIGIPGQVESVLHADADYRPGSQVLVCSSANGGLRVGILCLSKLFSGAVLRHQVLLAGANPIFFHEFDDQNFSSASVDLVLIGGGIDCEDHDPVLRRIQKIDFHAFNCKTLIYAGNKFIAQHLLDAYPNMLIVDNPLAESLSDPQTTVFEAVRTAYLSDIVHKEGVSELRSICNGGIRPTPEVVNLGFQRGLSNRSSFDISGASVVIDIGGATTDLHYTVEIVREDSPEGPHVGTSVARYVFTDLGIVASRDSTVTQMRAHNRIYEFLSIVLDDDVRDTYRLLREGEYSPPPEMLAYGCFFLAFERFSRRQGPGLPAVNFNKISHVLLTGGAVQTLDTEKTKQLLCLIAGAKTSSPQVRTDSRYQLWVDGISWNHD